MLNLDLIIYKFMFNDQQLYSKNLAKRLIHSLSQSVEAEEALISKLKVRISEWFSWDYQLTNLQSL